jgi:hypothetical protein
MRGERGGSQAKERKEGETAGGQGQRARPAVAQGQAGGRARKARRARRSTAASELSTHAAPLPTLSTVAQMGQSEHAHVEQTPLVLSVPALPQLEERFSRAGGSKGARLAHYAFTLALLRRPLLSHPGARPPPSQRSTSRSGDIRGQAEEPDLRSRRESKSQWYGKSCLTRVPGLVGRGDRPGGRGRPPRHLARPKVGRVRTRRDGFNLWPLQASTAQTSASRPLSSLGHVSDA